MQDNRIKPILFSTEMVRAILEGRKTVTRRDPFQTPPDYDVLKGHYRDSKGQLCAVFQCRKDPTTEAVYARYDRGDILWVRETWTPVPDGSYIYKASVECPDAWRGTWHPSIHMPKEAARLFLRVTGVRAELLQEITPEDIREEGAQGRHFQAPTRGAFADLWDRTVKPSDRSIYGWAADPWVWVIAFERCEKPEGWPK